MSRKPAPLPAALGDAFIWREALALGLTHERLRQPGVTRVGHALYIRRGSPADLRHKSASTSASGSRSLTALHRQREAAATLAPFLPEHTFFTGMTAATLWEMRVPHFEADYLEVASLAPHRALRRAGVRSRVVSPHLVRVIRHRGLPVSDPATTWANLSARLSPRELVTLGDGIVYRGRVPGSSRCVRAPLATVEALHIAARSGRRIGSAKLRVALSLLSTCSASDPETHCRLLFQEWGLPAPELDVDVYSTSGQLLGCSEFAYPALRLALEYEGDHHRINSRQWNRDIEKYQIYAQAGWRVIRITADLLYRRPYALRSQIVAALQQRMQGELTSEAHHPLFTGQKSRECRP